MVSLTHIHIMKDKIQIIYKISIDFIKKHRFLILFLILVNIGYFYRNSTKHADYSSIKSETVEQDNVNLQKKEPEIVLINRNLYGKNNKEKRKFLLTNFDMDNYIIGSENAPVTIIDYSSFTCVFCKNMRDEIKKIVEEFVVEKKVVNYVLRPYYGKKTLPLGALLLCVDLDKREAMAEEFFNINLEKTEELENELINIASQYGIDINIARKCINDEEAYDRIIYMQNESSNMFDLTRSPLLIINGKEYVGYKNYNQIKDIIEKNIKKNVK